MLSGAGARASSFTVPRSKTSRTPAESAVRGPGLKYPELQVLVPSEIRSGRAERCDHRAPAWAHRPLGQRPAGMIVLLHHPARSVGVQGEVQSGFRALPPPGDPDQGVDVLGPELERLSASAGPGQVLPGERDGVSPGRKPPANPRSSTPIGLLRAAAESPSRLPQRYRCLPRLRTPRDKLARSGFGPAW